MTPWVKCLLRKYEDLSSDPQHPCKNWVWWCDYPPCWQGRGRLIPGPHQPDSLTEVMSPRLSERLSFTNIIEEDN